MSSSTGFVEEKLINKVASLLDKKGIESTDLSIKPCAPGGNNRVFMLNVGEEKYLLKCYYSSPLDMLFNYYNNLIFFK